MLLLHREREGRRTGMDVGEVHCINEGSVGLVLSVEDGLSRR